MNKQGRVKFRKAVEVPKGEWWRSIYDLSAVDIGW